MKAALTPLRSQILAVINATTQPIHAQAVYEQVKADINLATVYRGLQYLENNHYIEAFTIFCSEEGAVRYYVKKENAHSHFFHCEVCHTFIRLPECKFQPELAEFETIHGCQIYSHTISLSGRCQTCKEGLC